MKNILKLLTAVILVFSARQSAHAVESVKITYQGHLREYNSAVTGTKSMIFKIYDSAEDGTVQWISPTYSVQITSGLFRSQLDPTGVTWEPGPLFLEIEVDGVRLSPREELTGVPYAINASQHSGKKYTSAGAAPAAPIAGDLWWNTVSNGLFVYDGTGWQAASLGAGLINSWTRIPPYTVLVDSTDQVGIGTMAPQAKLHISGGSVQVGDGPSASTFSASGYVTLANLGTSPDASRGRIFFDSNGQGALKISLDGTGFVPLSTGSATGGVSAVVSDSWQFSGDGIVGNALTLRPSSVTLQGNTFNAADKLVRLDGSMRLPAADGSFLTGATAVDNTKVSKAGDYMTGQLTLSGATFTVTGNAFSVGGSTLAVADGSVGIGTNVPRNIFEVKNLIHFSTSNYSTSLGYLTGPANTGAYNAFVGYYAGYSNTTGYNNSFLGGYAGYNSTTGYNNSFLGGYAGYSNNAGYNNSFLGGYAGYGNTTGSNNSFLGGYAGYNNTTGSNNSFLGGNAGYSNTTGYGNSFLGFYGGYNNSAGNYNSFLGFQAGYSNTTGGNNAFLGSYAGYGNNTGYDNSFLGGYAGYYNNSGSNNTFLGNHAGYSNTIGNYNSFLGYYAGYFNVSGGSNTAIGYQAGYGQSANSYEGNTLLGYQSGLALGTGSRNVLLGWQAGSTLTTGSDNIIIG
ncbi:MAG: hypothetical protein ABIG11_06780, partial [bacterium]